MFETGFQPQCRCAVDSFISGGSGQWGGQVRVKERVEKGEVRTCWRREKLPLSYAVYKVDLL